MMVTATEQHGLVVRYIIAPEEAVDAASNKRYLASVASNRRHGSVKTQTCNGMIVHDERGERSEIHICVILEAQFVTIILSFPMIVAKHLT
jgi:hypothetical protein